MLKKIKEIFLTLGLFSLVAMPMLATATVSAATVDSNLIQQGICSGSNADSAGTDATSQCDDTSSGGGLDSILKKIITIFSVIVGFVAVVMIIVGGIKYITSGGNDGNVAGAKNTIIYAVIGLIIVALAQILVHYVLKNAVAATNG